MTIIYLPFYCMLLGGLGLLVFWEAKRVGAGAEERMQLLAVERHITRSSY